jgi:Leucine-rich repeat (LRR) protein
MTYMGHNYLYPVRDSLTHLYLAQNGFTNISRDLLPEMPHLQMVDLSYNSLIEVEYDTFRNVRNLQVWLRELFSLKKKSKSNVIQILLWLLLFR